MAENTEDKTALVAEDATECVIEELRQRARDGENPIWIPTEHTERITRAMQEYYAEQYRLSRRAGVRAPQVTRDEILQGQCSVLGVKIEFEKDSRYDCSEMD